MTDISVIVPIYNAEQHVKDCIDSILQQSFDRFEVILVDDGSTDKSGEICNKYAELDERVRVFHKINEGVSTARNIGLKICEGKYIAFVDSDDIIENNYLKKLYDASIETDSDIVFCNYTEFEKPQKFEILSWKNIEYSGKSNRGGIKEEQLIVDKWEALHDYFTGNKWYMCSVWGMLVKKEFLGDQQFKEMRYAEDETFVIECILKNPQISLIPYSGYGYMRWEESVTKKAGDMNIEQMINLLYSRQLIYHQSKLDTKCMFEQEILNCYAETLYCTISFLIKKGDYNYYLESILKLKDYLRECKNSINVKKKYKILFALLLANHDIYWRAFRTLMNVRRD